MRLQMLLKSIRLHKLGKDFGDKYGQNREYYKGNKKGNCGYQQPTCSPLNKLCREDAVTG